MRMWKAVQYIGIPDSFHYHDALHDALYTALVGGWMGADAKQIRPPKTKQAQNQRQKPRRSRWCRGICETPFPHQKIRKTGAFSGIEDALNGWDSRRPYCPFCGERGCVDRWWPETPERYYSIFTCREHGRFICCLTLTRREDRRWRGRLAVLSTRPALLAVLEEVTKNECLLCHKSKKPGTGKRRKGKKKNRAEADAPVTVGMTDRVSSVMKEENDVLVAQD